MSSSGLPEESAGPPLAEQVRIDQICLEFEDQWQQGNRPRIEAFLSLLPSGSSGELLRELLRLEHHYLLATGREPNIGEYRSRFPADAAIVDDVWQSTLRDETSTAGNGKIAPAAGPGRLGRFHLIRPLGEGQFGQVWLARDESLDRSVAIKLPRREQLSREERTQFLREARAAAQLRHPHMVRVHEVGEDADHVYIVSEYIDGPTLADWLAAHRPAISQAVTLCRTLAEALHHAHEAGVVHRDLKPSNVLLGPIQQPVSDMSFPYDPHIADFGLAKRDAGEATITLAGRLVGTPAYMSPEQARGDAHQADRRSDVYSLGVILFQLLTGELPFRGNTRMLLAQIGNDEPPSPRKLQPDVPRDLETITLKCLEKNPVNRYATAQLLADEFQRYLRGEPLMARPVSRLGRAGRWARRKPAVATLLASLVLAITLGTAGITWQWRRAVAEAEQVRLKTAEVQHSLQQANQVVNDFLTKVSEERLLNVPGLQPLRHQLLQQALAYLVDVAERNPNDFEANAQAARALCVVGRIEIDLGQEAEAQQACEDAVSRFEHMLQRWPDSSAKFELSSALNILANCLRERGDAASAEQALYRACELLDEVSRRPAELLDERSRGWGQALALDYKTLAMLQFSAGRAVEARQTIDRGLQVIDRLVEQSPSDVELMKTRAILHESSGTMYMHAQESDKRLAEQKVATESISQCLERMPTSLELRTLQACYLGDEGTAMIDVGEIQAGTDLLSQSAAALDVLARENPQIPRFREMLCGVLTNRSMLLRRSSKLDEALQIEQQALDVAKSLSDEFPDNLGYRDQLASAESQLANSHESLGNISAAATMFDAAVKDYESLQAAEPHSPGVINNMADVLLNRAKHAMAQGTYDASLADLQRGTNLLLQYLDSGPLQAHFQHTLLSFQATVAWVLMFQGHYDEAVREVQRCAQNADQAAEVLVVLAGCAAECAVRCADASAKPDQPSHSEEYRLLALDLWRRGLAAGWHEFDTLKSDPGYAALRSLRGFELP